MEGRGKGSVSNYTVLLRESSTGEGDMSLRDDARPPRKISAVNTNLHPHLLTCGQLSNHGGTPTPPAGEGEAGPAGAGRAERAMETFFCGLARRQDERWLQG